MTVTVSLTPTKSESEARVQREDVCVALVKLTLETLFLVLSEIVSSCFLFNCLLSALHVLFFSFLFSLYLPFTSVPSPSHLSRLGALKQIPLEGDRHFSPAWCCPGGPRPRGRERKGRFWLSFINLLLSPRAVRVIFCHTWQKAGGHRWPPDICRPREGGFFLGGAASKSCSVWFVCLAILVWNPVEIWNPSNATDFSFIFFCCNQEKFGVQLFIDSLKCEAFGWVAWSFHVRGEMLGQWQEASVGVKCWQKRGATLPWKTRKTL